MEGNMFRWIIYWLQRSSAHIGWWMIDGNMLQDWAFPRLQERSNSAFRSMTGRCNLKLQFDLKEVTCTRDSSVRGIQLIALYQLHNFMAFESVFRGCTSATVCSTCSNSDHWLQHINITDEAPTVPLAGPSVLQQDRQSSRQHCWEDTITIFSQ